VWKSVDEIEWGNIGHGPFDTCIGVLEGVVEALRALKWLAASIPLISTLKWLHYLANIVDETNISLRF
jgi:hypothetical protein